MNGHNCDICHRDGVLTNLTKERAGMGIQENIDFDHFPKQGDWLGKSCDVCFNYDSTRTLKAICVRDDEEQPRLTIFRLDDGRHVLATECMHTMPK